MAFLNSLISWFVKQRMTQVDNMTTHPVDLQNETLLSLLRQAQDTVYGLQYDFSNITDRDTYRARLPIQTYEAIKPYVDRMMSGETEVLWPGEIKHFAKSSGTTAGKSKFIPVSKESLNDCHFKAGTDLFAIYLNRREDALIFDGYSLGMGGSLHPWAENPEIVCGDISAILMDNLPFWAEMLRTPSMDVALMDQWEEKIEKIAQSTIEKNVTSIVGVPSWTLVLIKRILEITGKEDLSQVWPNLEVFIHGGVSFTPYREQFQALIRNPRMQYLETYNATEGFFSIQDRLEENDMLLMLDYGIVYEFIPLEEVESDSPKTYFIDEVELGRHYAMVITTNSGLWRYMIGDTVVFSSLNPHRIRISGRTKNYINTFGEELIEENALKALNNACQIHNAHITDFTAAPVYLDDKACARHQWLIEFDRCPENMNLFAETLDQTVQDLNSDYEAKRSHNILLKQLEVIALPSGTFYLWLKSRGKLGGQHKVPHLYNDRSIVEEILKLL